MKKILLASISVIFFASVSGDEPAPVIPDSVNDVMISIIAPTTNTLWGIDDPQTDDDWQAFADRLIKAGSDARKAAENKDVDAMYAAGDILYPPCEECHIQFHSGLQ